MTPRTALLSAAVILSLAGARPASARELCVDRSGSCARTLQAALDRARDGDSIRIGRGTFAGGVTVVRSVRIQGAGERETMIRGGGPVVTIGDPAATSRPTVALSGLTVTGGVTHGDDGVFASGGGILVQPGGGDAPGATVTLEHVVVAGNRAEPTATIPSQNVTCPDGKPCPFALGAGGGISSAGSLMILHSVVRDNEVRGSASDADGGGIASFAGDVTIADSTVAHNRVLATPPNGRFAEGGGLFAADGVTAVSIRDTAFRGNAATLMSDLPALAGGEPIVLQAHAGAIQIGSGTPTTIDATRMTGNEVSATSPAGQAVAFDSALLVNDSPLTMSGAVITRNQATQDSEPTEDAGAGGSAVELDGGGAISDSRISQNAAQIDSHDGLAAAFGALIALDFSGDPRLVTVRDTVIDGNATRASSDTGVARVQGGGITNTTRLELDRVKVRDNAAGASGPAGVAQGAGVYNADLFGTAPVLTVADSVIKGNVLRGSGGIDVAGGGLFTTVAVTLSDTQIARNRPDQCSGC